jgi:hypothetical protein
MFDRFYDKYKNAPNLKKLVLLSCLSRFEKITHIKRFEYVEVIQIEICKCLKKDYISILCDQNCGKIDQYGFCKCYRNTKIRKIDYMPNLKKIELVIYKYNHFGVYEVVGEFPKALISIPADKRYIVPNPVPARVVPNPSMQTMVIKKHAERNYRCDNQECVICLTNFEENDDPLSMIVNCQHVFHTACIETLSRCPLCNR